MLRAVVLLGVSLALSFSGLSADKKSPRQTSLTGCLDQKDSNFVLVEDNMLTPIADLQAAGFTKENFAKHVGHKVTVYGQVSSEGGTRVMRVNRVKSLAGICAPGSEKMDTGEPKPQTPK